MITVVPVQSLGTDGSKQFGSVLLIVPIAATYSADIVPGGHDTGTIGGRGTTVPCLPAWYLLPVTGANHEAARGSLEPAQAQDGVMLISCQPRGDGRADAVAGYVRDDGFAWTEHGRDTGQTRIRP